VVVRCDQLLGHGHGDRRLADATSPDDGDKALLRQLSHEPLHDLAAADDPRERSRQVVGALDRGRPRRATHRALSQHNRCDEAITATRNIGQVATARLAVAERPSHGSDMDFEIALLNVDAGPDARDQLVLGDQVAGPLEQRAQDVERAAAKPNGLVSLQQQLPGRKETKGPKRERPLD
jgi:hypothetical protein